MIGRDRSNNRSNLQNQRYTFSNEQDDKRIEDRYDNNSDADQNDQYAQDAYDEYDAQDVGQQSDE